MIEIIFDMSQYKVTFNGHAESEVKDAANHDLICGCASILFYTLHENLLQMPEFYEKDSLKTTVSKGDASVQCTPKAQYEGNVSMLYLVIYNGLKLLEGDYPENISIRLM